MTTPVVPQPKLHTGGTLIPGEHLYIKRPAAALLLKLLRQGEYCNVLTSRQMGKSSLMMPPGAAVPRGMPPRHPLAGLTLPHPTAPVQPQGRRPAPPQSVPWRVLAGAAVSGEARCTPRARRVCRQGPVGCCGGHAPADAGAGFCFSYPPSALGCALSHSCAPGPSRRPALTMLHRLIERLSLAALLF